MSLIRTTAEIKNYLVTDAAFDPMNILPFIPLAEKEIIRALGEAQYTALHDYYLSGKTDSPELNILLPYVQRPLVFFAFLQGIDILNVVITNTGIAVVSTTNLVPASKDRSLALKQNIEDNAWDNIELLLSFLQLNERDYEAWKASDAYAYQYEYLVNSAIMYNEFIPIKRSRITFLELRPAMADYELLHIAGIISPELLSEIKKEVIEGVIPPANSAILPYLRRALAYGSYGEVYKLNDYLLKADAYLMEVIKIMVAAIDDYPLYRDSGLYNAELANYQIYENDEDSGLAIF